LELHGNYGVRLDYLFDLVDKLLCHSGNLLALCARSSQFVPGLSTEGDTRII
jgi:hypothetical protein